MDYSRDEDGLPRKERELTLSMSAILGIFFGLVLLCGLFFGLGYNIRGRQIASVAGTDSTTDSTGPQFNNFKPAAGSPAGVKPVVVVAPSVSPSMAAANSDSNSPANAHAATPANTAVPANASPQATVAPIVRLALAPTGHTGSNGNATVSATVATPSQVVGGPAPNPPATGSFVVQVAAVSHQEDADLLLGALKGRGYAVNARAESQDKLVHIQIGPFSNRREAEAMRQKLQGDGYNAIIK